jgi:aryl-alcohol dehydrogenase-like predicted oxidoreductase
MKISFGKGIVQTVTLGINGPTVTALEMGTWAWGDTLFWAYGKEFGAKEVAEAFQAPLFSALQQIGEKYNKTPAQVALNWLIAQGKVIPIPGAKNADQAKQNAGALGWSLSPEEVESLGTII